VNTAQTRQDYTILDYTVVNLYASGKQIQEILREREDEEEEEMSFGIISVFAQYCTVSKGRPLGDEKCTEAE
jgi:hypothetical protein